MADNHLYRIVTVERTSPPAGTTGGCWYKYVIANGVGTITGFREGAQEEVRHYARRCILRLNARDGNRLRPQGMQIPQARPMPVR